jgi:uncharacterized protein
MDKIVVEVCYAESSTNIFFVAIMISNNATIKDVLNSCGILTEYPLLNMCDITVGVNSKNSELDAKVSPNDRIVIYRPLKILPHEARKIRAEKNKIK